MTVPPEPPDRTALYWPEDRYQFAWLAIRDDSAAAEIALPDGRWFRPNSAEDPVTWEQLCYLLAEEERALSTAIRMVDGDRFVVSWSADDPAEGTDG